MTQASAAAGPDRAAARGAFLRHYVEMVLAMAAGMPLFGILLVSPLDPLGYRETLQGHPYVRELIMLVFMSIPMVGWMVYRGHTARLTIEMLLGMWIPAVVVVILTASALVPFLRSHTTMTVASHLVMLPGMFAAMWLRRSEYSGHHSHGDAARHDHADHEEAHARH